MKDEIFISCHRENHWELDEAHRNDEKIISLKDEYKKYWQKIINGENFALTRYGDGERSLMLGKEITAQEGWHADKGVTDLGAALKNSLGIVDKNFVYGISCPCCDSEAYYWYLDNLRGCTITFANLFVNANFAAFWKNFQKLKRDAVLITNYRGVGKKFGRLNIKKHYTVSDDCVNFYEKEAAALIQKIISEVGQEKNLLYAISAGPLSEVIIKALYENNPDNCYIDFGSALDICIHEKITRPYMVKDNRYSKQNCWMFDRAKVDFDVDVVLSAYKRPQVLAQQFEAIKNQTLKPRRIFLYQDAVKAGEEKIILDEKILKQLDGYEIAEENGGVWKRFEYAAEKTLSPYVCVFDDDTIPGRRWLENCQMNSAQTAGVFGTNGVILMSVANYPREQMALGWHSSSEQTFEVDFVGHSWFIRREYLNWMLEKPYKNRYKYVSEDMCLSAACFEHDVKTYVPAHPKNILSLWGSIPEYGWNYGRDKSVALSMNPENLSVMKKAIIEIHNDGWKILAEREPEYVKDLQKIFVKPKQDPLTTNIKTALKFFGKKPPAFVGDEKYFPVVKNMFMLIDADYTAVTDKNNALNFRSYALNIFFTDSYPQVKNFLESRGFKEHEHFIDGRHFLRLI